MPRWFWSVSSGENSTTSLDNLSQCSVTHSEEVLPDVQVEVPEQQFLPIASCPIPGPQGADSGSSSDTALHILILPSGAGARGNPPPQHDTPVGQMSLKTLRSLPTHVLIARARPAAPLPSR